EEDSDRDGARSGHPRIAELGHGEGQTLQSGPFPVVRVDPERDVLVEAVGDLPACSLGHLTEGQAAREQAGERQPARPEGRPPRPMPDSVPMSDSTETLAGPPCPAA